ncbi:sensor histidine kinase [Halomicroarcula sp. GCM10025817]|uniref:sensor histidine kinase n=1 Tax=Haloarcula TaxID=2237 RepID=UPI0023E8A7DE|nr:HAMP domain-containing sensor histidine kinase [Halomicroarcula sp. SYNS111]
MNLDDFIDWPRWVGVGILGVLAAAGPIVGLYTLLTSNSSSLLFIGIGTLFPVIVTLVLVSYVLRCCSRRSGDTLLITGALGSLLLALLFAVTATSIIWGQQTLGITMADPFVLITEMLLGGALFGLLYGHYYGLAILQRRRLREKTAELQQQNERLDDFASMLSHDLRNPLNVAQGRLELAQDDVESEHLDAVTTAHDRMEALIENLLELAQFEQADIDRESVDLETLVGQCWMLVDTNEATLVSNVDGTVAADRNQLQRLFENLFRNAVEHGGSTVTVTVDELEDGFYVEDDGPGIPPEIRDDVFESGFTTANESTGFGLGIVAEIARSHGWNLSVADGADGGARIKVTGVESLH